jgi:hypothetical protein
VLALVVFAAVVFFRILRWIFRPFGRPLTRSTMDPTAVSAFIAAKKAADSGGQETNGRI